MARCNAGEDRAGKNPVADHRLACYHGSQCTSGGYPERRHRLGDDILAQHRAESGTAIAVAREWRAPRSLQLDVASSAVGGHHLAQQDRAPVAELGHEGSKLVPGIGESYRLGSACHSLSG